MVLETESQQMTNRPCQCVFPAPAEEEIVTIPGEEPGTALRLYVDTGRDGYVRLQQLAYSDGLGWYAQKSMVIPRDVLAALVPQFRKAMCLMPPKSSATSRRDSGDPIPFPRIADSAPTEPLEPTGT
jgi:hypothetical protein